jgi:hypothetical protein
MPVKEALAEIYSLGPGEKLTSCQKNMVVLG